MENYGQLQAAKLGNAQPAPQMGVVNSLQELNNSARTILSRLRIIAERIDGPRPEPVSENGVKETPSILRAPSAVLLATFSRCSTASKARSEIRRPSVVVRGPQW